MNAIQSSIKNLLIEVYGDTLSSCDAELYAAELYTDIFVEACSLDSVYAFAYRLEAELLGEDVPSMGWYLFTGIVELLENGEKTAKRLYDCFLGFHDFSVLKKLLDENAEWLTSEEIDKVKQLAKGVFDREILYASILAFAGEVD